MSINKEKSVAITGYNISKILETSLELNLLNDLVKQIPETIKHLYDAGYTTFISCMNDGFEIMTAEAVIELKKIYPSLELIMVVVESASKERYSSPDLHRFRQIAEKADQTITIQNSEQEYPPAELLDFIAANSSFVICYCDGKPYKTVQIYLNAVSAKTPIINLCEKRLK